MSTSAVPVAGPSNGANAWQAGPHSRRATQSRRRNRGSPSERSALSGDMERVSTPPVPIIETSNNPLLGFGILEKLQTFLPTGTWVLYSAFQAWVLTLRTSSASPRLVCSTRERVAVIVALVVASIVAFISSFIKSFVYDSTGTRVLYPPPNLFNTENFITDPVTNIRFPCKTANQRYCYPFANESNELVYNTKGGLRIFVFKHGVAVHVNRPLWIVRVWRGWFGQDFEDKIPVAPHLNTFRMQPLGPKHISLPPGRNQHVVLEFDDLITVVPKLQPRWRHRILGAEGSKAYMDLRLRVWEHAFVSLLAFFALALFSPEINDCLYPKVPPYVTTLIQTILLVSVSFIAAMFLRDDGISLGQSPPRHVPIIPASMDGTSRRQADEVPIHLRSLIEGVIWIEPFRGNQDVVVPKPEDEEKEEIHNAGFISDDGTGDHHDIDAYTKPEEHSFEKGSYRERVYRLYN
ncbi:hypothetical protein M422DRAFT_48699 [Sphaerobolus stellatus SS14]|uniref:Uncharacterized protein n=1 Tax=Sphaerobolus stellatus (strain SS14) TaxID=990650 RepID=A0A0C9VT07_SPHS4|nr:hypothetical protein M422DRAFT_48699 [Sphaerobolus stellatus SS14]